MREQRWMGRTVALLAALAFGACIPAAETGLTYEDILCREDPLACRDVP